MKTSVWIIISIIVGASGASAQSSTVPESVAELFKTTGFDKRFDFSTRLEPSYLRGDFDGDGKTDVAILVKQKSSGKIGIAVCHSSTKKIVLIGAGTSVGNGGDNFDWMDIWRVTPKAAASGKVGKAVPLMKGDALHVEKMFFDFRENLFIGSR